MHDVSGAETVDDCVGSDEYKVTVDVLEKLASTPPRAEPANVAVVKMCWTCIVAAACVIEFCYLLTDGMGL